MRQDLIGAVSRHSGDINLVAAMMSQGVGLDPITPVSVITGDHGKYGSFRFRETSDDGSVTAEELMDAWNGIRSFPPDHGFSHVCRFISARPPGIQRSEDFMDFAVEYLTIRQHRLPGLRTMQDIPDFVRATPQSEPSYVLAYVWNREICYQLYNTAKRSVYLTEGEGRDMRRAIIDTQLPKWQARELLARLQG